MTTITEGELDQILADAELNEDNVRREYGGRGAYGQTCLGITTESPAEILMFAVVLADVLGVDKAWEILSTAREDSMGLGVITYFPGVTIAD